MNSLTTYNKQIDFARRWIKSGHIQKSGTWQHHRAWGQMWVGVVCGYTVRLETIGDGPLMKPGSFRVRALSSKERAHREGRA